MCTVKRQVYKTHNRQRLFIKDEERISLTIFEDKLVALYNMYKANDKVKDAINSSEEDITELLLSVEATIFYNKKFNITSIKAKKRLIFNIYCFAVFTMTLKCQIHGR